MKSLPSSKCQYGFTVRMVKNNFNKLKLTSNKIFLKNYF